MAGTFQNTVIVGTETSPISLGINGGATDVWTWTHSRGVKAEKVTVLDAVTRQPISPSTIAPGVTAVGKIVSVTTNSTTVIAIQNQSTIAEDVLLEVVWAYDSRQIGAPVAASAGVLS